MKKISVFLVLILVLSIFLVGCQREEKSVLDKEVIKVGMELKYPPFEYKDEKGEPVGASVDLAKALGEYLGKEVEIVDTPYPSLIPALDTGEIDIIISSMTITEEREKKVDFSDPYTTSQLMMLVNIDSPIESYEDLNNEEVIIASKTGTIGALWAQSNASKAQIKNVEEEATAVLEVAQGTADVFIYDPLSIIRHHENYPDQTKAILEPLPNTKGWGVAMRKGEEGLKAEIDAFLKEAKTDGTYDQIREDHLIEKQKEFEQYGIDFFF
ncbi:transporter substrate-binding domain-containing protein [Vallitalea okinawensis]|uniref:transporter substrate-binding domain-containing protein n=1 Tax=Vallitalea okinawensis TaxID=2078660 RepID=UPI000CFB561B|nr:transporter substrate-binding domain-containing protein [Vallitalea okinawensis]